MQSVAATIGRELTVLEAGTENEFDAAFSALAKRPNPGMIVSVDPLFDSHRSQLIALAERQHPRCLSSGRRLCRTNSEGGEAGRPASAVTDPV